MCTKIDLHDSLPIRFSFAKILDIKLDSKTWCSEKLQPPCFHPKYNKTPSCFVSLKNHFLQCITIRLAYFNSEYYLYLFRIPAPIFVDLKSIMK